jgi:thiamine kinase-like enzyme
VRAARLRGLLDVLRAADATSTVTTFSHGDASVSNALFADSSSVLLIDWDSAGFREFGWDLACLWVDVVLRNGRKDLEEAVHSFVSFSGTGS